jgi:repressor of nif and glnA expression
MVNDPPTPDEIKASVVEFHLLRVHADNSSVQLETAHPLRRTPRSKIGEVDSSKRFRMGGEQLSVATVADTNLQDILTFQGIKIYQGVKGDPPPWRK